MAKKLQGIWSVIRKRRMSVMVVVLLAAAGIITATLLSKRADASDYITSKIERGTVEVNVSATGTVQAVTTVQVGSQVSGNVSWLGADFNSQVKRGQTIAKLDPAVFQAQVDTARANVINAEAAVKVAMTEVTSQKANLTASRANQEVARVQRDDAVALVNRYRELANVISSREIEAAQAQANAAAARFQQAAAQVGQAEAANEAVVAKIEQVKADLARAKAQLEQANVNVAHTIIDSPIDGVVVSRNVDVGQTVAASLQAPTLFTIANDLTKMQVLASIDEADVGQIRDGIKANFTVDAFPGETFTGDIIQIRLNAQTLQNVVTYTAVIEVANPGLKLRPGMTANITVSIAKRENVLTVPNAALRFRPNLSEEEQQKLRERMEARRKERAAQAKNREGQPEGERDAGAGRGDQERPQSEGGERRQGQMVWVLVGANLEPRFVRTGLTNGRVSEVLGGNLNEGDVVVVGTNENNARPQQTGAPFGQRPPGGGFGGGRRGR